MENEVWRWLWTCSAVVFSLAEVFTAGFFLLPFAIGAAAAAVLAWVDAHILWQWLVFFVGSAVSFVYLRRFVRRLDHDEQPRVGANRLIDAQGKVIERVDEDAQTGMVRLGGEEWRASAAEIIEVDTRVMVTEIDGTHLVVVPVPQEQSTENTES
ncbi:MAG: NfeD family protein [bacterium]|nr:NfeD family protein [bacterium]MXZ84131.1 NfeD family protein [Acidimicrobiia bacterium]MYG71666.1 NfeD family protein [Acidimicrobiia bacterium]MYL10426.1 NfeD family protein [Acidimicrobiia bacterium]